MHFSDFKTAALLTDCLLLNSEPPAGIDSVIIPLKRAGKLFLIDAVIDNEQGNLIFDSGAMGLVLNRTYFRDYTEVNLQNSAGITGSVSEAGSVMVTQLNIGELSYKKIAASMVDLSHIENRRNIKVLGLIGFDLVRDFEIFIDLQNELLRLYRVDKKGQRIHPSQRGFNLDYIQGMEIVNGIAFVKVIIAGKTLRFCLDSAAETNALSTNVPKAVMETFAITRSSLLKGAGNMTREVFFGTFNDFTIGNKKLGNMTAVLSNLEHLSGAYGMHLDGILGYDFLIKGVIRLNFVKHEIGLQFYHTVVE